LFGVDGKVYALADGLVSIGGFVFSGQAATVQKNHPTTGRIPNGAIVEEAVCAPPIGQCGIVRLLLKDADSETARRITLAINEAFPRVATTVDAGTVQLRLPASLHGDVYDFMGVVGVLEVHPDVRARVVINERTGTVIVGEHVRLSRVAITHADLAIIATESPLVSQPTPFSTGETEVVPRTNLDVIEEKRPMSVVEESVTVGDLASALNVLGVTPRDLSSIFQQLKTAGALHADLLFE
jgi:flagellar P-ring protein precursor FlgI